VTDRGTQTLADFALLLVPVASVYEKKKITR
jgi:hypothetical protein